MVKIDGLCSVIARPLYSQSRRLGLPSGATQSATSRHGSVAARLGTSTPVEGDSENLLVADELIVKLGQVSEKSFGGTNVVTSEVQLVDQTTLPHNLFFAVGDMLLYFFEAFGRRRKPVFLVEQEFTEQLSSSWIIFGFKLLRKLQNVLFIDKSLGDCLFNAVNDGLCAA